MHTVRLTDGHCWYRLQLVNLPTTGLVEIWPLSGLDRPLTYRLPPGLENTVRPGCLVRVPLVNKTLLGVVKGPAAADTPPAKLKCVLDLLHPEPVLTADLLQLAQWMSAYYAAPMDTVFDTMIPGEIRQGMAHRSVQYMESGNILPEPELLRMRQRAPQQAKLYEFLRGQIRPVPKLTVLKRLGVSTASCDALAKKGLVQLKKQHEERSAYSDLIAEGETVSSAEITLNEEQLVAAEDLQASVSLGAFRTHLLHGVTGSGKTEVYLRVIRRALELGGGVVFLVPEVALTPQTVGRLRSRLEKDGEKVIVWHSHLSAGERFDAWFSLLRGDARVVVGARSAIFAPVRDLRLVVVDEEHEPAYKQAETPRYHGRDVAVYRAMVAKALCLLGSATPSLESLYNVKMGQYRLNRLSKRVDDRQLPIVHLVDLKREKFRSDGLATLSSLLTEKLIDRFEKKEQSILFLNRRGFSTSMLCPECSFLAECPHCDVRLTYHRPEERLKCHICGYYERAPSRCPQCGSKKIRWRGFGTQRVEDVVAKILPRAKIVRMDVDTMSKKNQFRSILADFRVGKIDILVGTQMIAKGLDFPNVTLVGLVDADISLHLPDFRASERTFQLLVQVSGRAGRGDKAGEVVAQSFMPQNPPLQYARRGDFDGFLEEELEHRREFNYPPFRRLIRHIFRGRNPEKVAFFAKQWTRHLEKNIRTPIEIRGPAPAPLEKIKDAYRFHTWYFVSAVSKVVPQIVALRRKFPMDEDVIDVLDVDPMDMG